MSMSPILHDCVIYCAYLGYLPFFCIVLDNLRMWLFYSTTWKVYYDLLLKCYCAYFVLYHDSEFVDRIPTPYLYFKMYLCYDSTAPFSPAWATALAYLRMPYDSNAFLMLLFARFSTIWATALTYPMRTPYFLFLPLFFTKEETTFAQIISIFEYRRKLLPVLRMNFGYILTLSFMATLCPRLY